MAYLLEKRGSALPILKKKRSMTMVIFFPYSVESCEGGHGISSREEEVCSSYSYEGEKDDHGNFLPFLGGDL